MIFLGWIGNKGVGADGERRVDSLVVGGARLNGSGAGRGDDDTGRHRGRRKDVIGFQGKKLGANGDGIGADKGHGYAVKS